MARGKRDRQQEDQRKVLLDGMGRYMFVGPRSLQEKKKTNGIGIWHKDTLRLLFVPWKLIHSHVSVLKQAEEASCLH